MMTENERLESLKSVKRCLIKAHREIETVCASMEAKLTTEYEASVCKEYGSVCRVMGILEEQIAQISNQITNFK